MAEHQLILFRLVTEIDLTHPPTAAHVISSNLATKEDDSRSEILEEHYRGELKEECIDYLFRFREE